MSNTLKDPSFPMVQYESTCLDMPVYFGANVHCRAWPPSRTIAKADSGKKNTCEPEAVDIVTGKVQLGICSWKKHLEKCNCYVHLGHWLLQYYRYVICFTRCPRMGCQSQSQYRIFERTHVVALHSFTSYHLRELLLLPS